MVREGTKLGKGKRNGDIKINQTKKPMYDDEDHKIRPMDKYKIYMPLVKKRSNILIEIYDKKYMMWPEKMKTSSFRKDKTKYCHFHQDYRHETNDYRTLKDKIEFLIRRGYLKQYMRPKTNV